MTTTTTAPVAHPAVSAVTDAAGGVASTALHAVEAEALSLGSKIGHYFTQAKGVAITFFLLGFAAEWLLHRVF